MNNEINGTVTLRKATLADVSDITDLINHFAARGLMLSKTLLDIYQSVREFTVAVDESGTVLGCGALRLMWRDLAEVRSLAVAEHAHGRRIGYRLVKALIEEGKEMNLARIFALTYQDLFFEKLGFEICEKDIFPQKVWTDCHVCPKRHCCDEIAMLLVLDPERAARANAEARAMQPIIPPRVGTAITLETIKIAV